MLHVTSVYLRMVQIINAFSNVSPVQSLTLSIHAVLGLPFLRHQLASCDTLCTSGFVDDVTFSP